MCGVESRVTHILIQDLHVEDGALLGNTVGFGADGACTVRTVAVTIGERELGSGVEALKRALYGLMSKTEDDGKTG